MAASQYTLADLLRVMQRLRDPEHGCPWDLEQDFRSIAPSTLEEAHELVEAIEHDDFDHIPEELGDVLFQVIFYSQMGSEQGRFDFQDIVHILVEKLVRRHPHVFANGDIEGVVAAGTDVAAVSATWENIKQQERSSRSQESVLDDIPLALPALSRAQKIQKRVSRVGFDWSSIDGVVDKIEEELNEFRDARSGAKEHIEEELGDLLFACVNLIRHHGLDAETALRRANQKFERRFAGVEQRLNDAGESFEEAGLERMDALWDEVKKGEGNVVD